MVNIKSEAEVFIDIIKDYIHLHKKIFLFYLLTYGLQ